MAKIKEKDIRAFLKEQKLTRAFNTFRRIKSIRKRKLDIMSPDYQGAQRRRSVLIYRQRDRTIIRDAKDLKVIASSRRKVKDVILSLRKRVTDTVEYDGYNADTNTDRGWNVVNKVRRSLFGIKNENVIHSYNSIEGKTTKIILTNKTPRRKYGFAVIDASYIGSKGQIRRVQARSFGNQPLWKRTTRQKAIENAINNGSAVAGFTPIEIVLHDFWFEYRFTKRETVVRAP